MTIRYDILSVTLYLIVITGNAVASDYEDFDGTSNSQGATYIETYTPAGTVPPANIPAREGALDAAPATVTEAQLPKVDNNDNQQADQWMTEVRNNFRVAYKKAGSPSIALFWNREFNDQLSQWYVDKRVTATHEDTVDLTGNHMSADKDKNWSTNISGNSTSSDEHSFSECKGGQCYQELSVNSSRGDNIQNRAEEFGFNSGFISSLLTGKARLLDRAAIMRLTQRDKAKQAGKEIESDRKTIETDSLIGYAEYLAEIIYSTKSNTQLGMTFLVTIKEVATGRIIVMFKSDARPEGLRAIQTAFVATKNGFIEQTTEFYATPEQVGKQLGYETMQALIGVI
jgi:hypothetical protein